MLPIIQVRPQGVYFHGGGWYVQNAIFSHADANAKYNPLILENHTFTSFKIIKINSLLFTIILIFYIFSHSYATVG